MNDLVNDLVDKLAALEGEIAAEKGDFALFAIVLREEAPDRWDLVVAAPWAAPERRRQSALADIVSQLKHRIRTDDLMRLSRIVFLKPTDRFVQAMNQAFSINHGRVEIKDSELSECP